MRILYGVVGEGMGHATRSSVLLEHLTKQHEVHVVVSGRARDATDGLVNASAGARDAMNGFKSAALDQDLDGPVLNVSEERL